jgi:hypothetical protein
MIVRERKVYRKKANLLAASLQLDSFNLVINWSIKSITLARYDITTSSINGFVRGPFIEIVLQRYIMSFKNTSTITKSDQTINKQYMNVE